MNKITQTSELRRGDILLWWSATFAGWLQWFFTRRGSRYYDPNKRTGKKSHTSAVYDVIGDVAKELNISTKTVLSDMTLSVKAELTVYRLIDVPQEVIDEGIRYMWYRLGGKWYPFLQWLTYPSRWLFEIMYKYKFIYYGLFGWVWHALHNFKDVREWGTVFPRGDVCSEGTLYHLFLWKICPAMIAKGDNRFIKLQKRLEEWDSNKFHTTDSEVILTDFPDIFEQIFYKPLERK